MCRFVGAHAAQGDKYEHIFHQNMEETTKWESLNFGLGSLCARCDAYFTSATFIPTIIIFIMNCAYPPNAPLRLGDGKLWEKLIPFNEHRTVIVTETDYPEIFAFWVRVHVALVQVSFAAIVCEARCTDDTWYGDCVDCRTVETVDWAILSIENPSQGCGGIERGARCAFVIVMHMLATMSSWYTWLKANSWVWSMAS